MADTDSADGSSDVNEKSSDSDEKNLGCEHYRRKCAFITPCCNKIYTCRVCHDEAEQHQIQRKDVRKVKCLKCAEQQPVASNCRQCMVQFGKYFCQVCNLFDDQDKKQFHCDACGICRVGGRDNFFHCLKCDMCLHVGLRESHKCVENASKSNCPVCLELLHTSRESVCMPPCGHPIHETCMNGMLKTGNYACPTCAQCLVDMKGVWEHLDEEIAATPMPDEYKDYNVQILCRDCHEESRVLFHVLGLKCAACGSYNTCRTQEPEQGANVEEGSQAAAATQESNGQSENVDTLDPREQHTADHSELDVADHRSNKH
ncbi:RING finger and CHY zinc finger domain-containing protein 1 isoform X1 [Lingula anatina]|uniref:RING finger and CHY zinc finger domain-containing protein 1 isoform X1 n=1 Tax=Lingula anatina TaxID=7574 RepID=A0A1S3IKI4_LINAN|nr:RING finger and CHY zinc finger domain-containing protein 1 isoform X1 [Lingula anatina]|eukprot:XP_013398603.1 RING finger and CHY zinc finger domain-containing protein 1 isoform X1 [Lingula anatina]